MQKLFKIPFESILPKLYGKCLLNFQLQAGEMRKTGIARFDNTQPRMSHNCK